MAEIASSECRPITTAPLAPETQRQELDTQEALVNSAVRNTEEQYPH